MSKEYYLYTALTHSAGSVDHIAKQIQRTFLCRAEHDFGRDHVKFKKSGLLFCAGCEEKQNFGEIVPAGLFYVDLLEI